MLLSHLGSRLRMVSPRAPCLVRKPANHPSAPPRASPPPILPGSHPSGHWNLLTSPAFGLPPGRHHPVRSGWPKSLLSLINLSPPLLLPPMSALMYSPLRIRGTCATNTSLPGKPGLGFEPGGQSPTPEHAACGSWPPPPLRTSRSSTPATFLPQTRRPLPQPRTGTRVVCSLSRKLFLLLMGLNSWSQSRCESKKALSTLVSPSPRGLSTAHSGSSACLSPYEPFLFALIPAMTPRSEA